MNERKPEFSFSMGSILSGIAAVILAAIRWLGWDNGFSQPEGNILHDFFLTYVAVLGVLLIGYILFLLGNFAYSYLAPALNKNKITGSPLAKALIIGAIATLILTAMKFV